MLGVVVVGVAPPRHFARVVVRHRRIVGRATLVEGSIIRR
jgi:hypothetical protein